MADRTRSRDRQRSPDVLADLLGAELPPPPVPDSAAATAAARAATRSVKEQPPAGDRLKRQAQPAPEVSPPVWETEIVTFQDHRGWRPRYVNGVEVQGWLTGPLVHDYVSQRGEEGWELAGATTGARFYGIADTLQLYFKRRR